MYCTKCSRQWGDKLYNVVSKTKDSVVIMTKHNIKKNCEGMQIFVRVHTVGASRVFLKKVVWAEGKFIQRQRKIDEYDVV